MNNTALTINAGRNDVVLCPNDNLLFRPYYSDGVCPVCQWKPDGVIVAYPWWYQPDPLWSAVGAVIAVALLMGAVVLLVFFTS